MNLKNFLKEKITIIKREQIKNKYGEYSWIEKERIETYALINPRRTISQIKISHQKEGFIEIITYECLIEYDIEINKNDLIEWNDYQFYIQQIVPVFLPFMKIKYKLLQLHIKER